MEKQKPSIPQVEIWGGIECIVNRVNDRYYDQFIRSGHHIRPTDIEQFAALGIRTMRYPLLYGNERLLTVFQPRIASGPVRGEYVGRN